MTDRAKKPYEGTDAYVAGYRDGYETGHDDAIGISQWHWDCSGIDCGVGVWRCEACGYINDALPFDATTNPYTWSGGKHCANCGRRMINIEVEDE